MYDGDVELFYKVLFAEISEHHYYDQMTMITALKRLLEEMDLCDGVRDGLIVQNVRILNLLVLRESLQDISPLILWSCRSSSKDCADSSPSSLKHRFKLCARWSSARLWLVCGFSISTIHAQSGSQPLVPCLLASFGFTGHDVDCTKLLLETEDGDQSEFMECVRTQYLQEIFEFPVLIHQALMRIDEGHTDMLSAGQISVTLQEIDPNKQPREIQEYMYRGIGLDMDTMMRSDTSISFRAPSAAPNPKHRRIPSRVLALVASSSGANGPTGAQTALTAASTVGSGRSPSALGRSPSRAVQQAMATVDKDGGYEFAHTDLVQLSNPLVVDAAALELLAVTAHTTRQSQPFSHGDLVYIPQFMRNLRTGLLQPTNHYVAELEVAQLVKLVPSDRFGRDMRKELKQHEDRLAAVGKLAAGTATDDEADGDAEQVEQEEDAEDEPVAELERVLAAQERPASAERARRSHLSVGTAGGGRHQRLVSSFM